MRARSGESETTSIETCSVCRAPVVAGRVHCSTCGECYVVDRAGRATHVVTNEVDEASIESFPASDPPGW